MLLVTIDTLIGGKCSVSFDQHFVRNPGHSFKCVNVLGVMSSEESFFVKQSNEIVTIGGLEVSRIQFFGQRKEWFWFLGKVVQFENCCRIRKFVFAQIIIETGFRRTEVRNSSG